MCQNARMAVFKWLFIWFQCSILQFIKIGGYRVAITVQNQIAVASYYFTRSQDSQHELKYYLYEMNWLNSLQQDCSLQNVKLRVNLLQCLFPMVVTTDVSDSPSIIQFLLQSLFLLPTQDPHVSEINHFKLSFIQELDKHSTSVSIAHSPVETEK